jgi:hypothetical protein
MIKGLLSAIALSRALGQDLSPAGSTSTSSTGSCPQMCLVGPNGPQITQAQYQGPVTYKNRTYNALFTPSVSLQLIDSVGIQMNYNFNNWILSNGTYKGQQYVSSSSSNAYPNIMIGLECSTTDIGLTSISNNCLDVILYMNPEYCRVNFNTNLQCPYSMPSASPSATSKVADTVSPSMTAQPSKMIEPSATETMTSAPTREAKPSETETMTSMPTRRIEPSATETMTSAPTKRVEPSATETMTSAPTRRMEPSATETMTSAPTRRMEPSATETMTSVPTREAKPSETETMTSMPTREAKPSETETMTSMPTREAKPSETETMTSMPTRHMEPSMSSMPSDFPMPSDMPLPSDMPTRPPINESCNDTDIHLCIRNDIKGPNTTITEPITAPLLSDLLMDTQFTIEISRKLIVTKNETREYIFSGWVIIDGMFAGQRFTSPSGIHKFVQFICPQRNLVGIIHVDDPCVPRIALMHPAFCMDMSTNITCMIPSDVRNNTMETSLPTRRPDAPSDKPTPRPTLSALPTRRPTLSALPTRVFRSPLPREEAKILRSRISIEVRNETMFENPKNVEAVVKTIVCALKVPAENVAVNAIKHYVDNILIRTIPVPVRNTSRNITDECMGTGPTYIPVPPQPTPIEPVAIRRLQSGLDTYVLDYQVTDPPATVVAMEPATVASIIETSPTLVTSLDIPPNSYVSITAEPPTYASEPILQVQSQTNSSVNNILMSVFIPIGVIAVGSIIAMTMKRRVGGPVSSNPNSVQTVMQFAPTVPNWSGQNTDQTNNNFQQTNPRVKIVRLASKHSIEPMQIRKV